jgi:hypothetical protein
VSAHRFASSGHFPAQADVGRFRIDGPPGEYVLHWLWGGYSDCNDIAVLPPSVVVPHTSDARYGKLAALQSFSRIDHCQYGGGRMQAIDFEVARRSDAIPAGECHDVHVSDWRTNQRTCFVIPPSGGAVPARNANSETAEEALAACQYRCLHTGTSCVGINVVPITAPPLLRFTDVSERAMPWTTYRSGAPVVGVSNCNMSCFDNEPNLAESMICYPLKLAGSRIIEEDWTLSLDDPTNEIWYRCVFAASGTVVRCTRGSAPRSAEEASPARTRRALRLSLARAVSFFHTRSVPLIFSSPLRPAPCAQRAARVIRKITKRHSRASRVRAWTWACA